MKTAQTVTTSFVTNATGDRQLLVQCNRCEWREVFILPMREQAQRAAAEHAATHAPE